VLYQAFRWPYKTSPSRPYQALSAEDPLQVLDGPIGLSEYPSIMLSDGPITLSDA
jgi:hypothetical protein